MNKKYILTNETTKFLGHTLHRIQAVKDFNNVKAGDLGGWIESEKNLSCEGPCWVYDEAKVYDEAYIGDEVKVYDEACVFDKARVFDKVHVYGEAKICSKACVLDEVKVFNKACVFDRAMVFDKACVYGEARVFGKACVYGEARVFNKAIVSGTTTLRTTAFIQSQYDFLSIENIGSRQGTITFYKTKKGGIDVVCGCFSGSIEEFLKAVEKTHGNNEHGKQYLKTIQFAKSYLT